MRIPEANLEVSCKPCFICQGASFERKFIIPSGYIVNAKRDELVKIFDRFENLKHSTAQPKAFTEKGLYMLATILKSSKATTATIAIIEAFAKLRELSHTIAKLADTKEKPQQKSLYLNGMGKLMRSVR